MYDNNDTSYHDNELLQNNNKMWYNNNEIQAGAELCQAQHSLSQLPTSLGLATNSLGLLSQLAAAGAGSLGKLQLRILSPPPLTGIEGRNKLKIASHQLGTSYPLAGAGAESLAELKHSASQARKDFPGRLGVWAGGSLRKVGNKAKAQHSWGFGLATNPFRNQRRRFQ